MTPQRCIAAVFLQVPLCSSIKLSSPETREFWEVPVLYEDDQLLALDKPSGLLSSADPSQPERPHLIGLCHGAIAENKPWARDRGLTYLMNVERMDLEASGVLLLAKSKPALEALANLFGSEKVYKWFVALVQGSPREQNFTVDAKIGHDPLQLGGMRVDPKAGKHARTVFEVRERFAGWTLLRCESLTHRTHQIRVHLKRAGFRTAGDGLYGGASLLLSHLKPGYRLKPKRVERPLIGRAAIHAEELALAHPVSGMRITITAPLPRDLNVAIKYLRQYAAVQEG
jgi:RluA family pseudouridine synthase